MHVLDPGFLFKLTTRQTLCKCRRLNTCTSCVWDTKNMYVLDPDNINPQPIALTRPNVNPALSLSMFCCSLSAPFSLWLCLVLHLFRVTIPIHVVFPCLLTSSTPFALLRGPVVSGCTGSCMRYKVCKLQRAPLG